MMRSRRAFTIFCVVVGVLAPGAGARAASLSGGITGTVHGPNGTLAADVCVGAYGDSPVSGPVAGYSFGFDTTGADGTYAISGLQPGTYIVDFWDCGWSGYVEQWYDGQSSYLTADRVTVQPTMTTSGIDATMSKGGVISGTLTGSGGESADTCIQAFDADNFEYGPVVWTYSEAGKYEVSGLPDGSFKLYFGCDDQYEGGYVVVNGGSHAVKAARARTSTPVNPAPAGYVGEWYNDQQSFEDAEAISVVAGTDVTGIDAMLTPAGGIRGTVTDGTGDGIGNICVYAYEDEGWNGNGWTDYDGTYMITGMPAGDYLVQFYDCNDSSYQDEYYDDVQNSSDATLVKVTQGVLTSDIDASLAKRARPDIALTGLRVAAVPIETDDVTVAHNPFLRDVSVKVSNIGDADLSYGYDDAFYVTLWATSETDGVTRWVGDAAMDLKAGESATRVVRWNALGMAGDVTLYAESCNWDDSNFGNNRASTRTFAGVGGTGVGVGAPDPFGWGCYGF